MKQVNRKKKFFEKTKRGRVHQNKTYEDKTYKTKQETLKLEPKTLSEQLSDGKLVSATLDISQLYYLVFVCIKQARHNNIICELASFRCLACYVKLIA